uniref:Potassium channel domain-containing protein n=1 Tax=Clytia hemisphaerica TaxID=252671 RepID=A0A7M5UK31_9CNID
GINMSIILFRGFLYYVLLTLSHLIQQTTPSVLNVEYYEMKPYIYTNPKTGHLTGMVVDTFAEVNNLAVDYCNVSRRYKFIKTSYKEVHAKWKLATHPITQILSPLNRFLFPIVREHIGKGLKTPLYPSESISVITKKYWVDGSLKFFVSLVDLRVLFSAIFVFVFLLACILFITEFRKEVARGRVSAFFGSKVWLLFVTMTSVGYGDIVPKRMISKIIEMLFMVFGLIIASILVGFISEAYQTTRQFKIYDSMLKVGVLKYSELEVIAIKQLKMKSVI